VCVCVCVCHRSSMTMKWSSFESQQTSSRRAMYINIYVYTYMCVCMRVNQVINNNEVVKSLDLSSRRDIYIHICACACVCVCVCHRSSTTTKWRNDGSQQWSSKRALHLCLCVCIYIHTYTHICVCVSQVINNNEVIKSHISAVVVKKGALHDSNQKTQLKSHCSNLGVCHVDLDSLEDWKETVHNFSNVCSLQNVLCGITRELTFGTFYKNHCFLHRK